MCKCGVVLSALLGSLAMTMVRVVTRLMVPFPLVGGVVGCGVVV